MYTGQNGQLSLEAPEQTFIEEVKILDTVVTDADAEAGEPNLNIENSRDNNSSIKIGQLSISPDYNKIYILDSHTDISEQLSEICKYILPLKSVTIACGYAYNSGFKKIKELLENPINANIPVKLLVGTLRHYKTCFENRSSKLIGIDRNTAEKLNEYIKHENFSLYTCSDRFYHGKIFMLESEDKAIICMGSSNISSSAFESNYELNIVFEVSYNSNIYLSFSKWIEELYNSADKLTDLDLDLFSNAEFDFEDALIQEQSINISADEDEYSKGDPDLELWRKHNPDSEYKHEDLPDDLRHPALLDYIAFVYKKFNLLVLAPTKSGNAYYCFEYEKSFEDKIKELSELSTKTDIRYHGQVFERRYHIENKSKLADNINDVFERLKNKLK